MSIAIREAVQSDELFLKQWLMQPDVLKWFPMGDIKEVEDSARFWISFHALGCCYIAEKEGVPCGSVLLNLTHYAKIRHQCLLSIIVSEEFRNQKIGSLLLQHAEQQARERFGILLLHLEVYEGNPARRLYERMGYVEYGEHKKFIREEERYQTKIMMQKWLNRE